MFHLMLTLIYCRMLCFMLGFNYNYIFFNIFTNPGLHSKVDKGSSEVKVLGRFRSERGARDQKKTLDTITVCFMHTF